MQIAMMVTVVMMLMMMIGRFSIEDGNGDLNVPNELYYWLNEEK